MEQSEKLVRATSSRFSRLQRARKEKSSTWMGARPGLLGKWRVCMFSKRPRMEKSPGVGSAQSGNFW